MICRVIVEFETESKEDFKNALESMREQGTPTPYPITVTHEIVEVINLIEEDDVEFMECYIKRLETKNE